MSAAIALVLSACKGSDAEALPRPVVVTPIANPFPHADPAFEPLPGAKSYWGDLNGGVYKIEIPDEWNGDLVVHLRGGQEFGDEVEADPPLQREYFIDKGYAWATTSYDRVNNIYGVAADQSAALWDLFVERFGRPAHTYAVGGSMGGGGTIISAERYSDRYDGALATCASAGLNVELQDLSRLVVAGAYATGLSPSRFEQMTPEQAIYGYIRTRLETHPEERSLFEEVWTELTGGPRPLAERGLAIKENAIWSLAWYALTGGRLANSDEVYELHGTAGISDEEFNSSAVRMHRSPDTPVMPGEEFHGGIKIPLLLVHTTGDGIVPLMHARYVVDRVEERGESDLLSAFFIPAPEHCEFSEAERDAAFEELVTWVRDGVRPTCPSLCWSPEPEVP